MKKQDKKVATKTDEIELSKIKVFFKRSMLKNVLKILLMHHDGFRTLKSVKNINKLFNNIDLSKYEKEKELKSFIWCICFASKQWLEGIVSSDIIYEMAKRNEEYDNIKGEIFEECINDQNILSAPEANEIFNFISEALQYGCLSSVKDEYIELLDDIDMNDPSAFKTLADRLFLVSQSLMDIKYNTNMIANSIEFNTSNPDSIKESLNQTISSLAANSNIFKTGIRRLNTLLSPGYMNGRIYVYLALPSNFKSGMLLKTALDIRKYNTDFKPRTPGMRPCVLYITMENTFVETIERIWNMEFDDRITNYSPDEALDKLKDVLGIQTNEVKEENTNNLNPLQGLLLKPIVPNKPNIDIVIRYYPYKSINTDDLFTIIQDLADQNQEVCCLILDYIKRINPTVLIKDNIRLELDRIMNELKALAVIKNIPVITAHQMNRAAATTVDSANRQGKSDLNKMIGRDNISDSWNVYECADWAAVLNIEYKPGTDDKYLTINTIKRRRIDIGDHEFSKYTYLAHPFSKTNGLKLVDDINLDKVLSLQSLITDINVDNKEKANATQRLQIMPRKEFIDLDNIY